MSRKDEKTDHLLNGLERTAMLPRDFTRKLPKPIVVEVFINGKSARALLDTGSLADFMSTMLADQLKVRREPLRKPLSLQLEVHGSRSKINFCSTVELRYQEITEQRTFDIVNLDSYDLILGTPFIFQHQLMLGLNPTRVVIGSSESKPIQGESIATIQSAAADVFDSQVEKLRKLLRSEAENLCVETSRTALPPLRAVNHPIPLIDENKVYSWRPSKCPEAFRDLWREKKQAYLNSGRWRIATGTNACPLLIIPKPSKGDGILRMRTVVDKRQQNSNTKKLMTPLPDIEVILRNVVRYPYRSILDGKDAYEQIRVKPEDVYKTLFTTPDGTMESLVLQIGDCNGPSTYQTLMNHIFAEYIGVFMEVYLDDIVVYSNTVQDHVKHIRKIFDVLRQEKLYLAHDKMHFFATELKILGHIIDEGGIVMDPHKVTTVLNWKTPTNKGLLASFIGAVGYLAGDSKGIRIPMGVLSPLTGSTKLWKWGPTQQRAFDEVKRLIHEYRSNHRVALDYSPSAEKVNLVTDACFTGASGTLTQGNDIKTAKIISFWSGKFTSAQQNYPVHEQELLVIIESLKRFRTQLLGLEFRICTDHKALEFIMTQKALSPRQYRWVSILNEFDFVIQYIPGETNVLADSLSRIYSHEPVGVVRSPTEYVSKDSDSDEEGGSEYSRSVITSSAELSTPVYTGSAVVIEETGVRRSSRIASRKLKEQSLSQSEVLNETGSQKRPTPPRKSKSTKKELIGSLMSKDSAKRDESNNDSPGDLEESLEQRIIEERVEFTINESKAIEPSSAPRLTDIISEGNPGIDIPGGLRGRFHEDKFFAKILPKPLDFKDFAVEGGLVFLNREDGRLLCVPNILIEQRNVREIIISHAHSILAHLGWRKTSSYLRGNVWWPDMIRDITDYCKSCSICAMSKPSNQKSLGLLRTLEIPTYPWQAIGIDFVGPLPGSRNRHGEFDSICVIIDHLTSMVHLVPSKTTYKAKHVAEIIFDVVYKLHGLPERIISDRDSLFTSIFWKELHRLLGTELRLSSSYHPQTDGTTERANRTMTQMLRQCVSLSQRDWVTKLPAIEFAMNCARSETTGFSPFFLNYGRMPRPMIWNAKSEFPGVRIFAQRMKDAIMTAHDEIIEAQVRQTIQANRKRRTAEFKLGDLVYLSTKNLSLPKKRARKLTPKYIGPFSITKEVEPGATFKLELSSELRKRGINPTFHASLLRIHVPNYDRRFPGRQLVQLPGFGENPQEWAVERILRHSGKGINSMFEILWNSGDKTWFSYEEIKDIEPLESYLEAMGVGKIGDLPYGKVSSDEVTRVELTCVRPQETRCFPKFRGISDIQGPINRSRTELKKSAAFEFATHRTTRELRAMNNRQLTHRRHSVPVGNAQNGAVLSNQAFETLLEAVLRFNGGSHSVISQRNASRAPGAPPFIPTNGRPVPTGPMAFNGRRSTFGGRGRGRSFLTDRRGFHAGRPHGIYSHRDPRRNVRVNTWDRENAEINQRLQEIINDLSSFSSGIFTPAPRAPVRPPTPFPAQPPIDLGARGSQNGGIDANNHGLSINSDNGSVNGGLTEELELRNLREVERRNREIFGDDMEMEGGNQDRGYDAGDEEDGEGVAGPSQT